MTSAKTGCKGPGDEPGTLCGRKVNAHGLCSTHNRQGDELRPIRAIRKSTGGLTHAYGLSWDDSQLKALSALEDAADRRKMSVGALIVETLTEKFNPKKP
jgi:hypothetical protein